MRAKFFELLYQKMEHDESIAFLYADVGLGIVESFHNRFGKRVVNVGIAEQNLIGVAAGFCNVGYRPFCYSFSNFITQRALEQIRDDAAIPNNPITIIGTTTGFENGKLGPTHTAVDDIGCIKSINTVAIYSPSTIDSVQCCLDDILLKKQPAYIRLPKSGSDFIVTQNCNYYAVWTPKSKLLLLTYGALAASCVEAAQQFENVSVFCMDKVYPLDEKLAMILISTYEKIIIIEDQFSEDGLTSILAEWIVLNNLTMRCKIQTIRPDTYMRHEIGSFEYLKGRFGAMSTQIISKVKEVMVDVE